MTGPLTHRVAVAQLGARMHYAVPRLLHESGNLAHFYTDACADRGVAGLLRLLPPETLPSPARRLAGRRVLGVPKSKLTSFGGFGIALALARMTARSPSAETALTLWGGRRLSKLSVAHGLADATAVYGFSGECSRLLAAAKARGLATAVEQIIAPRPIVDLLVREEEARFPHWRLPAAEDRNAAAFAAEERTAWRYADLIVCGSAFVREHVVASGVPAGRCVVVPYGVAPRKPAVPPVRRLSGPLKVITVGSVGLRKGSPYVLAAAERLRGVAEFRMIGQVSVGPAALTRLAASVTLVGQVPRAEIAAEFANADVFLLPSICEGSATAVYEALAAGLPVITTPNTGTVVRDGVDGFIVPIRDTDAIVGALATLAEDRALLRQMARNAAERSAAYDLAAYGLRLREALAHGWSNAVGLEQEIIPERQNAGVIHV